MSQLSYHAVNGNGGNTTFSIDSFSEDEIEVYVDGVLKTTGSSNDYTIPNYSSTGGTVTWVGTPPSSSNKIRIVRKTDLLNNGNTAVEGRATYAAGSSVKADDLNNNQKQVLRSLQERQDQKIQRYDLEDGEVIRSKIAADAVDGSKIADDSVDSEHLVADSIDTEHYAPSSIDATALGSNSVTNDKLTDNSVRTAEIKDLNVTTAKLENNAVANSKLADNAVDSRNYVDGSIDHEHLANDIVDADNIQDDAVGAEHIQANAVTDSEIATGTLDNRYYTETELNAGQLDNRYYTETELDAGQLDNRYYTETELNAGQLDNRYFTETELTSGALDGRYFTETEADARYFNISTGDTIKDGDTFPDNDTTIATTAAINDRVIDLIDDVGGFVPILHETYFPSNNPDINNGTGTIVSIQSASTDLVPSGTTVTVANGRGSGLPVIITGVSATIPSSFGFLVETTTTDHTYTFHRLVPKATEVTTVAGISGNVTTVATNIANVNTVASDLNEDTSEIDTVATNIANVNTVGTAIANVNTTAGAIANVNTVATNISNVNAVGTNISNVNSVNSNASNINSAVSNASNITTVAGSISNVNTVGGAISNVNTAATNIASINTAASNISNVNNFTDRYQIASSDPSTDGGGNALAEGDLYFNTSADELKVYNGGAWQGGVTATGNFAVTTGNTFTGDNIYNDGIKAKFGTGSDLNIFHNGSDSVISQASSGTGDLKILSGGAVSIECLKAGAVNITHNGTKMLETSADGVVLAEHLELADSKEIRLGASDDLKIYHDGSHSFIRDTGTGALQLSGNRITMRNGDATSEYMFTADENGAVELYYDNVKKLETTSSGITVTGGITASGSSEFTEDVKFDGATAGRDITFDRSASELEFADNSVLVFGDSTDLQMYHDGTDSYIDNNTGVLRINNDGTDLVMSTDNNVHIRTNGTEEAIKAIANGAVELYHDGTRKLHTRSDAINIIGDLDMTDADGYKINLGASSDLQIYHNGTDSYITNTTGELKITDTGLIRVNTEDFRIYKGDGTELTFRAQGDGACTLYYDNGIKAATDTNGITVTGRVLASGTSNIGFAGLDNVKLSLGTSDDLQIYHDGTNDRIDSSGTYLIQEANNHIFRNTAGNEDYAKFLGNGAVELYHNGSKKFETQSVGIHVTGDISLTGDYLADDNEKIKFGDGFDLQIYHSGSHGYIANTTGTLQLENAGNITITKGGSENMARFIADGAVELYHDNSKRLETNSTGIIVKNNTGGDDTKINIVGPEGRDAILNLIADDGDDNADHWRLLADASGDQLYIQNYTDGNWETNIMCDGGGQVELYHNNSKKFETTSGGGIVSGALDVNGALTISSTDEDCLNFSGNATDDDRGIAFNGRIGVSADYNDGYLRLNNKSEFANGVYTPTVMRADGGFQVSATTVINSSGQLIASRLTGALPALDASNLTNLPSSGLSTSGGTLTGTLNARTILPTANNTYDLGSTSARWRNIYTNDLHLSNVGHSNDVDGTWGDWTIQEGESDLFLKNNRSGKKYKFNLMEVS